MKLTTKDKVGIALMSPFVTGLASGIGWLIWNDWPYSLIVVGIITAFISFVVGMGIFMGEEKHFP